MISLHRWHLNLKSFRLRNLLSFDFPFFGEPLFRLAYQLYQRIYIHCHNFAFITRCVILTECLSELSSEINIYYPTLAMLRRRYYILWLLFPTDLPRELYWISFHYRRFLWHHRGSFSFFFRSPNLTRRFLWAVLLFVSSMCRSCFHAISRALINLHGYFDSQSFCTQANLKILHHEHLSYI